MLMISVSENFLVESEWFVLTNQDVSLPSTMHLYIGHSFYETQLDQLP